MSNKKPELDEATIRVAKRLLSMPPKPRDEMKVGRPPGKKKRRRPKDRAACVAAVGR
jgi:hypothetical protein